MERARRPTTFADVAAEVIRRVPAGRVVTYGRVAALAGSPRAARLVVWVLNSSWRTKGLPWHRVVAAPGRIALKGEGFRLQRRLLRAEGVAVGPNGLIDLDRFGWPVQQTAGARRRTGKSETTEEN